MPLSERPPLSEAPKGKVQEVPAQDAARFRVARSPASAPKAPEETVDP